ncbi:MAG: hypothetical protein CVV64_17230 [Candidatus Wallbacteria bacterium HGW-Wallbacteria-1]|jgi:zinc transport system substrate-binding protein|uniref:Zinc ABC transporter substrate-binding protein n=1 Tax=Candidatus Wallbacteria bacterium HGW-Wallbacteria-1 TaxID=2013854 RepID=A0A2N1PKH6_9BACT|nr:MAG: hypothetical protein CVV64_17230 [Candidatus Wallbacteria bacterium HGW-Wallbacteria-1]
MEALKADPEVTETAALFFQARKTGDWQFIFMKAVKKLLSEIHCDFAGAPMSLLMILSILLCFAILISEPGFCGPTSGSAASASASAAPASAASASASASASAFPLKVHCSFFPVFSMAEAIAGPHASLSPMFSPDQDPSESIPSRDCIRECQNSSDLILLNGAGFEKWMEKVTLPMEKIVETAAEMEDTFIFIKEEVNHSHGAAGLHSHQGLDGHTWLSPIMAIKQADAIFQAFTDLRPHLTEKFKTGFNTLKSDLMTLDQAFRKGLKDFRGTLVASHPAYNYWAREYGVNLLSFTLDPNEIPEASALEHMKSKLNEITPPPRFMLWESQPAPEVMKVITDNLGLRHILFSPCEAIAPQNSKSPNSSFVEKMHQNLERLFHSLEISVKQ